jgi:hypothetical protein
MHSLRKPLAILFVVLVITIAATVIDYRTIPTHNTNLTHFDTIIVLGTPANLDGTPSPEQRERTLEGVREFKAGSGSRHHPHRRPRPQPVRRSPRHGHARPRARCPTPAAVIEEDQAQNTIQNIFYSQRIMASHQWTSAEVISSPSHLPRTALILEHYPLVWRTEAAPWPSEYSFWQRAAHFCVEAQYCLRLKIFGFPSTHFLPHPA